MSEGKSLGEMLYACDFALEYAKKAIAERDAEIARLRAELQLVIAPQPVREEHYRQCIIKRDAEIAHLREALADYGRHDSTCLAGQWRQGRPTSDGGYETLYGYSKNMKWYREPARPPCTCGLFAALEVNDANQT